MPDKIDLQITSTRRVGPKPDGTPRRNSFEFDVIVDGSTHTIRIRRESGAIKCAELERRPDWPAIKELVVTYLVDVMLKPALEHWQAAQRAAQQPP